MDNGFHHALHIVLIPFLVTFVAVPHFVCFFKNSDLIHPINIDQYFCVSAYSLSELLSKALRFLLAS